MEKEQEIFENAEAMANRNPETRDRNRNRNQNSCGKDKHEIGSTVYSHVNNPHTYNYICVSVCIGYI